MKLFVIVPLFCISFILTLGQDRNLDSLQTGQQRLVEQSNLKIDSIQSAFYQKSDSLKNLYKSKFSRLDSSQSKLRSKLDSLTSLQLSAKH